MRKLELVSIAVLLASVFAGGAIAAVPQVMNYQGILKNAGGAPVADGSHNVTFRLYNTEAGGSPIWEESRSVTTESGLFTVLLGSLVPVNEAHFVSDAFLGIEVESDGELTPRTKIASVGYAFRAANSDKLDGYDASELRSTPPGATSFTAFVGIGASQTMTLFTGVGERHITSVYLTVTSGNLITLRVDGVNVLSMQADVTINPNAEWNSCSGAPIRVPAGSLLEVQTFAGSTAFVAVTGWEY